VADQPNRWQAFLDQYEDDAELFVREVLGVGEDAFDENGRQIAGIYPDQLELLQAYSRRDRRIAKRSGHGVGKTTSLAWVLVHHAVCRFPQKAVCTAPTSGQLFDALYSETVTWFKRLPDQVRELYEIKSESIELIASPTESFISFRTSSPEKPEALAGVHSEWVVLIGDEASGIPEAIFETAVGSMSGHNAVTILTGNPVRTSGLFFDVFHKPELMKSWTRLHVTCVGHPNVSDDFIEQVKDTYGEGSNAYRVRVEGEFPAAEANTVIPYELAAAALARDVKPIQVLPIWGLDVGLKQDPSCLAKRRGNVLEEPTEEFLADDDLMRVVAWVKAHWDRTLPSMRPSEICIDSIGMGAGVAHRLLELGLPSRCINVSESAAMKAGFVRLRDELWWSGREWLQKRDCNLAGDERLVAELVRPTYEPTVTNKIQVEAKRATIKRTKSRSPNRADSFLLTLASEAITASGTDAQPRSWKEAIQRPIAGIV
jgi:phage terminase large subunit